MVRGALKEKIKPLWISLSNRWGGPEQVAMSDMIDLAQSGVAIRLLCLEGSPIHAAALRHPSIEVRPIPHAARTRFDWNFKRGLRAVIDEVGANIVHINDERILWHLVPALFRRRDVSVIASRYSPVAHRLKEFIRAPLLRRLDYMIVLNEGIRASLFGMISISEKKLKVINLGLDFSRFDPATAKGLDVRKAWGADKDTIVVGSVGRLLPEVGQDTFLKAAAGLLKHKERKMKFVIVAEEPVMASEEYVTALKGLVSQFHMEEFVTFAALGESNLPDVMSAFDIFVMPGREEVPGLGALEAMAMERPVVLSRVVGADEIVGNNEFGLLVRPEDAFDLQQKILTLLENPSTRLSMGANGRRHVLKHFDKRIRFNRTLDVYEKCMKRRFARLERSLPK